MNRVAQLVTGATMVSAIVGTAWWWKRSQPDPPIYPPQATAHGPQLEADTPANAALRGFPVDLDGVDHVFKVEVAGATHVLVHIRQVHPDDRIKTDARMGGDRLDRETLAVRRVQMEMIITVQGSIVRILRSMAARGMLTTVSPEGFLQTTDNTAEAFLAVNSYAVLPDYTDPDYQKSDRPISERMDAILSVLPQHVRDILGRPVTANEIELLMLGGIHQVVRDRLVRPVSGESWEQNVLSTFGMIDVRMDARENAYINAALGSATGIFAVVIMGGKHDFCGYRSARDAVALSEDYQDQYDVGSLPKSFVSNPIEVDPQDGRIQYDPLTHVAAIAIRDKQDPEKWVWCANQDNLALWNQAHPHDKASLLVITPQGYNTKLPGENPPRNTSGP